MNNAVRFVALVGVAALALVACAGEALEPGGETTTTSSTATTTTSMSTLDLRITIGTGGSPDEFVADLTCGGEALGDGYLSERAEEACDFLTSTDAARSLLINGPVKDRVCTEIHGGGEVARIEGTIGDTVVARSIGRANGCGIADWELLQPVLVEPYDLARQEACSGGSIAPGDEGLQDNLPPPVAEARQRLVEAAHSCDFDGLGALAIADGTHYSFGGDDDPAVFWWQLEEKGGTPLAAMLEVLQLAPGLRDVNGTVQYVWPAVAALDNWSDATEHQRQELADVFGDDALADWDGFGGYIGYRVGITEDGTWAFFVAGD